MSFLRPTASSRSRSNPRAAEAAPNLPVPSPAAQPPPPPQARQLFGAARRTHLPPRRPVSAPPTASSSAAFDDFSRRCDSVMQRAQELLARTRDQEALIARVLEQRHSQSPARRATPPPAPHTTPVAGETPTRGAAGGRLSGLFGLFSPQRTPPPVPQTTPVAVPASPSLYDRVRGSLQRLSGTLPPAPAPSPVPDTPAPAVSPSPARKSIRFASPDRLEHVTRTPARSLLPDTAEAAELHVSFDAAVEEEEKEKEKEKEEQETGVANAGTAERKRSRSPSASPSANGEAKGARKENGPAAAAAAAAPGVWERHVEVVEFVQSNTVKRCLNAFTKADLLEALKAEGVAKPSPLLTKRKLLDELRGLLGSK